MDACFIIRDAKGQALAYVYFEEEPGRRSAAKLPYDEARRSRLTNQAAGVLPSRETPETTSGLLQPGEGPSAANGYPLS